MKKLEWEDRGGRWQRYYCKALKMSLDLRSPQRNLWVVIAQMPDPTEDDPTFLTEMQLDRIRGSIHDGRRLIKALVDEPVYFFDAVRQFIEREHARANDMRLAADRLDDDMNHLALWLDGAEKEEEAA